LRVAHLTSKYVPFAGGVEQHVQMLARGMVARGHHVDVLTSDADGRLPPSQELDGARVRRFRAYGASAYRLAPGLSAWLWRNSSGYDVLHAHSYHQPLIAQAALAARGTRLVLTPHYHGVGHTTVARALHYPWRPLGAWALRRAHRVVCVSEAERTRLERDFGTLPYVCIPNGVDVEALLSERAPAESSTHVRVLSVGRLEPYKQPLRLLEAVPALPDTYEVAYVGAGSLRPTLERRARDLGVDDRVRILGKVTDRALRSAYRSADVFVSLSLHEAFGMALLEAAVAGSVVVASDIPPHREVAQFIPVDRIEFVAADSTPGYVAQTIVRASARRRLQAQPSWPVPTWDHVAERTLDVYRDCLAGSALPSSGLP
jgi:glycosyltransferase involved in cell wall biosynthesis